MNILRNRATLVAILFFVYSVLATAQTQTSTHVDGLRDKTQKVLVLTNCTLVPAPGEKIEGASIVLQGSKILAAGKSVSIPAGATIRDCKGMWCYAGFVEPYSNAGIGVAKQAEKPIGFDDDGDSPTTPKVNVAHYWNMAVNPQQRAVESCQLDDKTADEFRRAGFTTLHVNSMDGIFRGNSAVVLAKQGSTHEITLATDVAQWISFRKGSSKTPYPSSMMGSIALIRQAMNDAEWYSSAQEAFSRNHALTKPETNVSLEALSSSIKKHQLFIFETENEHSILRAHKIADEFKMNALYEGNGYEYRRLNSLLAFKPKLILPVSFPAVPDVSSTERALDIAYDDLLHWDAAPENAQRCDSVGLVFAFTTHQLKSKDEFLKNVRKAVRHGLKSDVALAALTTRPAEYVGLADQVGKVAAGYYANLVLCDAELFGDETQIRSVFVAGDEFQYSKTAEVDCRGHWTVKPESVLRPFTITLDAKAESPSITAKRDSANLGASLALSGRRISFKLSGDSIGLVGQIRFSGEIDSTSALGTALLSDGRLVNWTARRDSAIGATSAAKDKDLKKAPERSLAVRYPNTAFGFDQTPRQQSVLFKNATVWTCAKDGVLEACDVLIKAGKIVAVGKNLSGGDTTIDASSKHISPGIIDEHSHIAIEQGVNEGTHAITAEVRIGDVLFPDDINIYRQLSGGVTSSHLLHGSANPIGGQLQLIKLRWGADADGLKFQEAAGTIKFALGENVKQSNWGDRFTVRYPQTRMGVDEIMRDGFRSALEYERQRSNAEKSGMPVRKDLQLETLLEIMKGQRFIHCHSYVQSEILMLMRLAEDFNFKVKTFTHILEGYKLAREMKEHGASASSFSDWWAYKYEVFDAIPQNTGILHEQGVVTSVNSDDAEMARRLNQESAKAVKYGGVSQEEALKMCTINPAIQLGVDGITGSIEVGKQADLVLWSANPLSNMSRVLQTYVDGRRYFDVDTDRQLRDRDRAQRATLEQRALKALANGEEKASGGGGRRHREYECEDIEDEVQGNEQSH